MHGTTATVAALSERAHRRRWGTLGVTCLGLSLIGLDNTILNVALPTLVRDLDATDSQLQWMVDSYTLIFAGLLLTAGTLGDRFGRRRALSLGLLIFAASSVWAAWAHSADELIVARTFMGIGGAFIMPATLSVIIDVFRDPIERGKAIGIWAAVSGLAIIGGPSLGGWLLTHFWWGSVFLINVPICLLGLLLAVPLVPESRDPSAPRVDVPGMLLSAVGLAALVWAIIEAPNRGWTSAPVLTGFAAAAVALVVFVLWERRVAEPMLDLNFFRDARFSASSGVITLAFFALLGSLFFLSQYLQFVLGYDPLGTGVRLLPFATMAVAAPASIAISQRIGLKPVVTAGMAITGLGLTIMAMTGPGDDYSRLGIALGTMGVGLGATMAPATEAVMASLPPAKAGVGSAVNDTTRQVGGALGVAVLGSLLVSRYGTELPTVIGGAPVPDEARKGVGQALAVAAQVGGDAGARIAATAVDSFVGAMGFTVMFGALAAFLGAMVAAIWLPMTPASPQVAPVPVREPVLLEPVAEVPAGPVVLVSAAEVPVVPVPAMSVAEVPVAEGPGASPAAWARARARTAAAPPVGPSEAPEPAETDESFDDIRAFIDALVADLRPVTGPALEAAD